jgi:hypothetical protein
MLEAKANAPKTRKIIGAIIKLIPTQIHVMKCVSITCHFYISDMFAISCEEINNTYDTSLCCKVNG